MADDSPSPLSELDPQSAVEATELNNPQSPTAGAALAYHREGNRENTYGQLAALRHREAALLMQLEAEVLGSHDY
eukprot:SAG31_NODE_10585_length_1121_cov_1.241683_3_plen_75_part_00